MYRAILSKPSQSNLLQCFARLATEGMGKAVLWVLAGKWTDTSNSEDYYFEGAPLGKDQIIES